MIHKEEAGKNTQYRLNEMIEVEHRTHTMVDTTANLWKFCFHYMYWQYIYNQSKKINHEIQYLHFMQSPAKILLYNDFYILKLGWSCLSCWEKNIVNNKAKSCVYTVIEGAANSEPDLASRRELMSTPLVLVLVMKHIDQLLHKTLHSLHIV